jgi:hypothetical protein
MNWSGRSHRARRCHGHGRAPAARLRLLQPIQLDSCPPTPHRRHARPAGSTPASEKIVVARMFMPICNGFLLPPTFSAILNSLWTESKLCCPPSLRRVSVNGRDKESNRDRRQDHRRDSRQRKAPAWAGQSRRPPSPTATGRPTFAGSQPGASTNRSSR